MAGRDRTDGGRRAPLSRERVVTAAIELADRDGIESISMRRVAQDLGVEAMSLYSHVRSKDDLLAGMADAVIGEIPTEVDHGDWKASLRAIVFNARTVVQDHPWAPALIASRAAPGPAALSYINTILGLLRRGGFSVARAHDTLHVLGSRLLGFTQDLYDDSGDPDPAAIEAVVQQLGETHPYVVEMALAAGHSGALGPCDDDAEFTIGLDLILDGLDRLVRT